MRSFFNLILQLIAAAILIFILTGVWIVFDGINDVGDKADVGLAIGHGRSAPGASDAQLDRVAELYKEGRFPTVIVVGSRWQVTGSEDAGEMVKYLENHGVPSKAITADDHGNTTQDTAEQVADLMKVHDDLSVMIVANYYQITRTKVSLSHQAVLQIEKAHVGTLQKEDALNIAREVVAFYDYLGKVYLLPLAEQARKEAKVGMDKASTEEQEAKDKVNRTLDTLPK
jgi:vancomycin permeability regulator SanA